MPVYADMAELLDALLAAGFAVSLRQTPVETVAVEVRGLGVTAHGCGVTVADALRDAVRYLPEVRGAPIDAGHI